MAKATYGTGTSLMVNVGSEWITPASGLVTTIAWGIDGAITYACEGLIHVTGGVITWLRDGLGIIAEPHETEHLARTLRDNEGVYIVPAFVGLGIPCRSARVDQGSDKRN
jgi:glycerol kinase